MPLLNDAGKDADAVYLGSTAVDAVYLGADKVWPSGPPGVPFTLSSTGHNYNANSPTGEIGLDPVQGGFSVSKTNADGAAFAAAGWSPTGTIDVYDAAGTLIHSEQLRAIDTHGHPTWVVLAFAGRATAGAAMKAALDPYVGQVIRIDHS